MIEMQYRLQTLRFERENGSIGGDFPSSVCCVSSNYLSIRHDSHCCRLCIGLHELERDGLNAPLLQPSLHILVDLVGSLRSIDLDDTLLALELVDHRHAGFDESAEPLLDGFNVVIRTTRRLATVEETLQHNVLGGVEEKSELGRNDRALKGVSLIKLTREACTYN